MDSIGIPLNSWENNEDNIRDVVKDAGLPVIGLTITEIESLEIHSLLRIEY